VRNNPATLMMPTSLFTQIRVARVLYYGLILRPISVILTSPEMESTGDK
jgi:hypothetical protein